MIRYIAKLDSELWMRKCQEIFDSVDDMKGFIADSRTRYYRLISKPVKAFDKDDVLVEHLCDFCSWLCLSNCSSVIVDGEVIGYCGE